MADGRDWVTSNSRASRASKNLLVCPTVHRRSQDTDRYSPTAQAWVGTEPQPAAGTPVRERGGGTAAGLTTEASMAPLLRTPLTLPTNSSSSLASSTTRDGCSAHRARNCELSTLHREVTAGPQPPPGPRPWSPFHNQSQEVKGEASEPWVEVQTVPAPKGTQGPLGRRGGCRVAWAQGHVAQAFEKGDRWSGRILEEGLGPAQERTDLGEEERTWGRFGPGTRGRECVQQRCRGGGDAGAQGMHCGRQLEQGAAWGRWGLRAEAG